MGFHPAVLTVHPHVSLLLMLLFVVVFFLSLFFFWGGGAGVRVVVCPCKHALSIAQEALRLIKVATQQAATDPKTGTIDMNLITTGVPTQAFDDGAAPDEFGRDDF
jgi:hypothetical protein